MKQELQVNGRSGSRNDRVSLFNESYLEIFHDRQISSIHAVWKGYQSVESIQDGCERILDSMVVYNTYRVLHDHTHVLGIWRFASMWLATEWFPRMKQAGLQHFAWVYSPAKLSQLSTNITLSLMEPESFGVKAFYDIDAAKTWLRPRSDRELSTQPERLRAFVVDDNHDFAQLFRDMLQIMGCDATPAFTAQAGLELIKASPPDIIFCDIGLPGAMDGFDFARALKADERFSLIPLIAVSGYASDENRQRAIHAGFDRVCSKPVKFAEVSEVLAALAQGTHPATQGSAEAPHSHSKDPVVATLNRLAELKRKLNLKPSQQAAWETFSNALTAQARAQAQSREKMKGTLGREYENMPTPEKMEKMAGMMRSNADSLSKTASDTKAFYDVLSAEQKAIFDLFSKNAWNNRMREHMHDDMH